MPMRNTRVAGSIVVVLGRSVAALELIETTLRQWGHHALTTTSATEVVELARNVRIDVLVGDYGAVLTELELELRLMQPDVRVVRICDPDELQRAARDGAAIARPVSLHELEALVASAASRSPRRARASTCRASRS